LVTQTTGLIGTQTTKSKVVTKITEYFWKFDVAYELVIFPGNNLEDKVFRLFTKVLDLILFNFSRLFYVNVKELMNL
jgi:hypothetical protein